MLETAEPSYPTLPPSESKAESVYSDLDLLPAVTAGLDDNSQL